MQDSIPPLHREPEILVPAVEIRDAAEPVDVEWETVDLDTGNYADDGSYFDLGLQNFKKGGRGRVSGDPLVDAALQQSLDLNQKVQAALDAAATKKKLLYGALGVLALAAGVLAYRKLA